MDMGCFWFRFGLGRHAFGNGIFYLSEAYPMTSTPLTAKEKLEHIAECPDGCGVCKLMANDVRARVAELEQRIAAPERGDAYPATPRENHQQARIDELEAENERLRLWLRRIDNINDDPAHFSKEIDQACIDALAGKPMVGKINAP